ncbi:MAG: hypothetical protein SFY81_02645 [Verrucomicrobiota bacterium]|nr:hypothetical protein [Verrucomicrobiota bacterium]
MKIDTQNAKLRTLLSDSTNVTAEADHLLLEAAKLRAECQAMMLKHFFEVSRTMSAAEGRRYLAFVQEKAFHASSGMHATNSPPNR